MKKIINIFIALFIIACPTITRAASEPLKADTSVSNAVTKIDTNNIPGSGQINITGTIIGPALDGKNTEPYSGATVMVVGTNNGVITDLNGKFTLTKVPKNASVEISYVGCTKQTLTAKSNMGTITLACSEELDEVIVTGCKINKDKGEKTRDPNNDCKLTECVNNTYYEIKNNECVFTECIIENGTGQHAKIDNKYQCRAISCNKGMAPSEDGTRCEKCPCGKTANADGTSCVDWDANTCTTKPNHAKTIHRTCNNGTEICIVDTCDKGYQPNETENATSCIQELKKCKDEDVKKHPNAKQTGIKEGTINTCIATECNCGYTLDKTKGECIQWTDKDESGNPISKCDAMPDNAKSAHLTCIDGKSVCKITECISTDFDLDDQKNKCINKNKKPCTSDDKNATDAEYRTIDGKTVCFITDCKKTHTPSKDGTKCNPVPRLSEEDSQKKVDELKENAKKMKEKEQSTENKLLGAAGIGATGIGAMNLMSAAAEQSADQKAEAAMKAYLATFHCNYGAGKNIPGGETEVQLPGGNELVSLYAEYVNLANDLKVRKAALDMRPGIESESILDSATSGLYDDIAIGKTSGAFTSLARALSDPNSADAAAWAQQKADTASKLKTGAITAGIGAVGSLVGNLVINSGDDKKNKMSDIIDKFDKKKRIFEDTEQEIQKLEPQGDKKCPSGATGTFPNCDCGNKIYNSNDNTCYACEEGGKTVQTVDGVKVCKCPADKPVDQNGTCVKQQSGCTLTGLVKSGECACVDNATAGNDNVCKCKDGFDETNGTCTQKSAPKVEERKQEDKKQETKTISLTMPADSLFLIGKSELSSDAKTILANFKKKMENENITNCTITVTGHTDRTGKTAFNKTLSEKRAQAVWNELKDSTAFNETASVVEGKGLTECTCGTGPIPSGKENDIDYRACKDKKNTHTVANMRYAPCRRVVITLDSRTCTTPENTTLSTALGTVAGAIAGAGTGTN